MTTDRPERWGRVLAIGVLAVPAILVGISGVFVTTLRPPSAVWKWATGAQAWALATPVTSFLQILLWLFVPPTRWYGRTIAALLSVPSVLIAIYVVLLLIGPR